MRPKADEKRVVVLGPLYKERLFLLNTKELRVGAEYVLKDDEESWKVGGSTVNVASELNRLGVSCMIIGAWSGNWALASERAPRGNKLDWNVVGFSGRPGRSCGIQLQEGDATFFTDIGVNRELRVDHVLSSLEGMRCPTLLLITGYVKLIGVHKKGIDSIVSAVRGCGGVVALDTGRLAYPLEPRIAAVLEKALRIVDVFLPNESEAQALIGQDQRDGLEAAKVLASRYSHLSVILKMNRRGAAAIRGGQVTSRQQVERLDAEGGLKERRLVGAGDIFNATFLVKWWIEGAPESVALEAAVASASRYVRSADSLEER